MKRREFITLLGGAAVTWPFAARAQQPGVPVVGFIDPRSPDTTLDLLRAFRLGLRENSYVERENVAIEYRWADNQLDRLSALAKELVRQRVSVIVTSGFAAAQTAKAATTTLPIVFLTGDDPVKSGLVANLPRPAGNLTGISFLAAELAAKRLICFASCCLQQTVWPRSLIRRIRMLSTPSRKWKGLVAPSGYKSKSLMLACISHTN